MLSKQLWEEAALIRLPSQVGYILDRARSEGDAGLQRYLPFVKRFLETVKDIPTKALHEFVDAFFGYENMEQAYKEVVNATTAKYVKQALLFLKFRDNVDEEINAIVKALAWRNPSEIDRVLNSLREKQSAEIIKAESSDTSTLASNKSTIVEMIRGRKHLLKNVNTELPVKSWGSNAGLFTLYQILSCGYEMVGVEDDCFIVAGFDGGDVIYCKLYYKGSLMRDKFNKSLLETPGKSNNLDLFK